MGTFYYPDRTSPTTTVTISPLEAYDSHRPVDLQHSWQETPGGKVIADQLGPNIQHIDLNIKDLPEADMDALKNFILNTANGSINYFDFTDDLGVDYDKCRFKKMKRVDPARKPGNFFSEVLHLRQDID